MSMGGNKAAKKEINLWVIGKTRAQKRERSQLVGLRMKASRGVDMPVKVKRTREHII